METSVRRLLHDSRNIVELAADNKVFFNTKRSKMISKLLNLDDAGEGFGMELLQSRR